MADIIGCRWSWKNIGSHYGQSIGVDSNQNAVPKAQLSRYSSDLKEYSVLHNIISLIEVGVAVRELVKNRGFFGLWQGLSPSLLRDVPFSGKF